MQKIIAIRSLISTHHAQNIQPKIFSITWNIGKRCNFDCSYCSPTVHDWSSPHLDLIKIKTFLEKTNAWAIENYRTVKWTLTGGEPFLHPNIIEILSEIKATESCDDILTVTSNGSLPLDLYQKSLTSLTNLTISLHFDRPEKEVEKIVEKIIKLNQQNPNRFITVQVLMFPGKFKFIKQITEKFVENSVKHVYRRIRPYTEEIYQMTYGDLDKHKLLKTKITIQENQEKNDKLKNYLEDNLLKIYKNEEYYTADELVWLEENVSEVRWNNIGVWDDKEQYHEMNSDELVSQNLHQFKGWTCYIGVDCAAIDPAGDIFRGACTNGGVIGSIENFQGFVTEPTQCGHSFTTGYVLL
jgi:organic radical activating enzyme